MRLSLAQLRKLKMPYSFEEELNLEEELNGFEDIVSVGTVYVCGIIKELDRDKYLISMKIKVDLIMESAISSEEIPYCIETETEEVYSVEDDTEGDVSIIVGQTLDTKEAILTSIIIEKPMRITGNDEEFISDEIEEEETEGRKVNPAFASLKDLLK